MFHLLDEVNNLLFCCVARDEVVKVLHDVHADAACQVVFGLVEGGCREDEGGEDDEDLEEILC